VDVVDRDDELLEEPARLGLAEPAASHDVLKHVAARGKLHRDAEVAAREEDLLELDDVRVDEAPVVQDLALDVLGDLVLEGAGWAGWVRECRVEGARFLRVWNARSRRSFVGFRARERRR
jgi:hypothetical protein